MTQIQKVLDSMYKTMRTGTRTATGEEYYYIESSDDSEVATALKNAIRDGVQADIGQMEDAYKIAYFFLCEHYTGEPSSIGEWAHEWADSYVPMYTNERTAWLARSLSHLALVDDACSELGNDSNDIAERIGLGMYLQARNVANTIVSAAQELVEEEEDTTN